MYPTGLVYYSLWNMVLKWFMEEHTRDKVIPAVSLSDVQELIADEFIPQALGGASRYVFRCEDFNDPVYPLPAPAPAALDGMTAGDGAEAAEDPNTPSNTKPKNCLRGLFWWPRR